MSWLGLQYKGPRFRAPRRRLEGAHAEDPIFHAMTAIASELCSDYAAAEAVAERALAIEPRNPWAQHALSHVLIRQGRVAEGLARLESFLPLLAACGRPIHFHDAWHPALLHLEELHRAPAMRVFRTHIWGITPDFGVEQLDAIALLWRIEMAAGPMYAQWPSIAEHIAARALETFMPFMNA